jgi:hypothetical protein
VILWITVELVDLALAVCLPYCWASICSRKVQGFDRSAALDRLGVKRASGVFCGFERAKVPVAFPLVTRFPGFCSRLSSRSQQRQSGTETHSCCKHCEQI